MALVQMQDWQPDRATLDTGLLTIAKNVYPSTVGFKPVPALTQYGTDALAGSCVGMAAARTSSGGWVLFAGTATKLYKLVGTAWEDVSRTVGGNYAVPSGEYWQFAQYGDTLIAVNIADAPQSIDVNSGTDFAALGGSPPQARYVWIAGKFVFLGALSTDQWAVRNSAIDNPAGWTVGTDLCSEESFPDGGRVTGGGGGEYGYILQEQMVRRMIFQPGQDIAFRFEKIEDSKGNAGGYSAVFIGGACYYLAEQGFMKISGAGIEPIGAQRVDEWFRDNADTSSLFSVLGFLHPMKPYVMWAFTNSAIASTLERVIVYDWMLNKWSYFEENSRFWSPLATAGVTLEGLDALYANVDVIPYSLDSRIFEGGRPTLAAIDTAGKLAFLEGAVPLPATLRTCLMQFNGPDGRAIVTKASMRGEPMGTTRALSVGTRNAIDGETRWRAPVEPTPRRGVFPLKADGQFHEFELTLTHEDTSVAWKHVTGIDVTAAPSGQA